MKKAISLLLIITVGFMFSLFEVDAKEGNIDKGWELSDEIILSLNC